MNEYNFLSREEVAKLVAARLEGASFDLRTLENGYHNFDARKTKLTPGFIEVICASNQSLAGACKALQIPYLPRLVGFEASKWQRKRGYFRPEFGGIVIRIIDYNKLMNYLQPTHEIQQVELFRDSVYSDDDH